MAALPDPLKKLEVRIQALEAKAEVSGASTVVILNAIENLRRDNSSMFQGVTRQLAELTELVAELAAQRSRRRRKGPTR